MSTDDLDELGPIDVVVIGFPADAPMTGEAAPLLVDLVDRGIIRVLDVLFVTKGEDGAVAGFNIDGIEPGPGRRLHGLRGRQLRACWATTTPRRPPRPWSRASRPS